MLAAHHLSFLHHAVLSLFRLYYGLEKNNRLAGLGPHTRHCLTAVAERIENPHSFSTLHASKLIGLLGSLPFLREECWFLCDIAHLDFSLNQCCLVIHTNFNSGEFELLGRNINSVWSLGSPVVVVEEESLDPFENGDNAHVVYSPHHAAFFLE